MNSNPRTYNSVRNLTISFLHKLVSILLTFIGRQIFLRVLSVEYLGINSLFGDIISMLSLADLGLMTAMAYSFYKPLAEKDEDKLAALIGYYKRIYNIIAAVVGAVGVALVPFLKLIIKTDGDIPYIEVYYLITLCHTVVSYLFVYKSTIIRADQNSRLVSRYTIWTSVIVMAVQVVVLLTLKNYMVYCIVPVFGTLANNLIISKKANELYPFIKNKVQLAVEEKKKLFKNVGAMFVYKLGATIYNSTDSILISVIAGTAIVGKYANYRLTVTNLSSIAFILFSSLTPSIGNLVFNERPEKRLQIFKIMQSLSCWLGGFFVFCLFFLMDDFVLLWLGPEYLFDLPTKLAVLLNFYQTMTIYPLFAFREATGIYQKTKYAMLAGAALNLILSIVLGNLYGLPGILFATALSKFLTFVWYEPGILFRDYFDSKPVSYFTENIINIILLSACIALAHFLLPWGQSTGWLSWIIKGIACTLGINAVYFLRYFRTAEFKALAVKVKVMLKRSK